MGFFEKCLLIYLLINYIKNNDKELYDKLNDLFNYYFIEICHKAIYTYSYLQILYNKNYKKLVLFIEQNKILEHYCKNNNIPEIKYKIEYFNQGVNINHNLQGITYDIIVISDGTATNKIITNNEKIYLNNNTIIFEQSEIKFILVEFIVGDKHFKLDFKTDTYNFYVVGNIINRQFILYFMNNIYDDHLSIQDLNKYGDKHYLKILDHEVNELMLEMNDDNDNIIIQKNSYSVNVNNSNK